MTAESIQPKHSSFVSPFWDFIFVGGLTFVLLPIVALLQGDLYSILILSTIIYGFSFFLNSPHFMYSYQILYTDFMSKIKSDQALPSRIRYFLSGIIVPPAILGFFAYAYIHGMQTGSAQLLGYAVNFMLFFVGWHYVKQGYGVLITLSVKKRVFFSEFEKKALLYNAYIVWMTTWVFTNGYMARAGENYLGIPFTSFDVSFAQDFFFVICAVSSLLTLLIFALRMHKGDLSFNGFIGYICALYLWTGLLAVNPFAILVIPALHSLQYLLFVGKMQFEKTRAEAPDAKSNRFIPFMALGVIIGVFAFFLVPVSLDLVVPYEHQIFGTTMFTMMFLVFINIHHYFIDFAIWRKDNPDMKYLYQ